FTQSMTLGSTVYLGLAASDYGTATANYRFREFGDTTPVQQPTPPAAPTGLNATASSSTQIDLAWTAASGATSYRVERKGPSDADFVEIATGVAGTTYSDLNRTPSTSYDYRVRAENSAGLSATYSNVSTAITPSNPVQPALTSVDIATA